MIQVIDEEYIGEIMALPNGAERMTRWVGEMISRAENAEAVAQACIEQVKPLRRQNEDLQTANTALVFAKRDLRTEMQAEIDAAYAELDRLRKINIGMIDAVIARIHMGATNEANDAEEREWYASIVDDLNKAMGR